MALWPCVSGDLLNFFYINSTNGLKGVVAQGYRGKPLLFTTSALGSLVCITQCILKTYGFTSHSKDAAIIIMWLAFMDTSVTTGMPELESGVLIRLTTTGELIFIC